MSSYIGSGWFVSISVKILLQPMLHLFFFVLSDLLWFPCQTTNKTNDIKSIAKQKKMDYSPSVFRMALYGSHWDLLFNKKVSNQIGYSILLWYIFPGFFHSSSLFRNLNNQLHFRRTIHCFPFFHRSEWRKTHPVGIFRMHTHFT